MRWTMCRPPGRPTGAGLLRVRPGVPSCDPVYGVLRNDLLGYDLDPAAHHRVLAGSAARGGPARSTPGRLRCEDGLLDLFADVAGLYRAAAGSRTGFELEGGSSQEYLLSYLQWLDPDRAGLPEPFRRRLATALGRYGISGLQRSPELESAVVWMFRSFRRAADVTPAVATILQRRLREPRRGRRQRRPRAACPARPAGAGHPGPLPAGRRPGRRPDVPAARRAGAAEPGRRRLYADGRPPRRAGRRPGPAGPGGPGRAAGPVPAATAAGPAALVAGGRRGAAGPSGPARGAAGDARAAVLPLLRAGADRFPRRRGTCSAPPSCGSATSTCTWSSATRRCPTWLSSPKSRRVLAETGRSAGRGRRGDLAGR